MQITPSSATVNLFQLIRRIERNCRQAVRSCGHCDYATPLSALVLHRDARVRRVPTLDSGSTTHYHPTVLTKIFYPNVSFASTAAGYTSHATHTSVVLLRLSSARLVLGAKPLKHSFQTTPCGRTYLVVGKYSSTHTARALRSDKAH